MHKLLERQLRKHFGGLEAIPKELLPILGDVSSVYAASDQDRTLLERSLELTSQELMQRNHALRDSEERYRRMIETATEGIMVSNEEDEVIFANDRFAEMLGLSVSQMIGQTVFDFMRPED